MSPTVWSSAGARGMLRAVGMGDDDFAKPQIGVPSSWNEITPCNLSLDRLAKAAKEGVHAAGGYPLEFGTISVSDGISMGHEGMHFSLVSREVIADSVETVMRAERLDGSVLLAGCDKCLPGMLMAAARLDLAAVFLYAGSILPGRLGRPATSRSSTRSRRSARAARADHREDEVDEIERAICPGEGACGGCTPPTRWPRSAEALGMSLPGSAAPPAVDRRRDGYARESGEAVVELLAPGITARQIMTKEAFENAIAVSMALGGSTNAVLHLLAIAHEAEVELDLDDFNRIGDKVPHLGDLKPFGRYVMNDVDRVGGIPVVMKALLDAGLMHGDCLTVTGKTMAENLDEIAPPAADGDVIRSLDRPDPPHRRAHHPARIARARRGGRQERRDSTTTSSRRRPGSSTASARRSTPSPTARSPPATPSSSGTRARRAAGHARDARDHRRDQGRRTRQGRPAADRRAVLGGTTGFCVGHIAPEAVDGGPIAFVSDGDRIRLDVPKPQLELLVDDDELDVGGSGWEPRRPGTPRGVLAKYREVVQSAAVGAVCG